MGKKFNNSTASCSHVGTNDVIEEEEEFCMDGYRFWGQFVSLYVQFLLEFDYTFDMVPGFIF